MRSTGPRRTAGHLELGAGRARLDGELSAPAGLAAGPALGLRGRAAGRASISAICGRVSRTGRVSACGGSTASRCRARARRPCSCPAAPRGPAFLVTDNYAVIKTYNSSDAYALGRRPSRRPARRRHGAFAANGRRTRYSSTRISARKCSSRLLVLGHYQGDTDGKFGSKTREAVRNFQLKRGIVADGYADVALLRELRAAR